MKRGWMFLLVVVGLMVPVAARAQVSVYGAFSVSNLTNLSSSDNLYGVTTGVLFEGPKILHIARLDPDIQGRFVHAGTESLNGVTIGPRISIPMHHGFAPYAEFMIGFARYNNINNPQIKVATTDSTIQMNGGIAKKVSPRWDVVGEYSYAQYYAGGGEYNPKTYSFGAVYHFVKR